MASLATKDRARDRAGPVNVLTKRRARLGGKPDLDPRRLVFVDKTWTATSMARTHGR